MSEIRAGGWVARDGRWVPADLAEEKPKADEGADLSEFHLGGGWYQIGDEKVQGKEAAREALEA